MDNKKVEEALGEIFDKCGVGIVGEPIKFRSAFFDLLDEWHYKDERVVFRIAIESGALWPLASAAAPITGDMVAQVMEQLRKSHMTDDDAEFVVRCIIAARGGDSDMMMDYERKQEEERKRQEEEQRRREDKQKQLEEKLKQLDEKQRQREEEQRQRKEEQRQLEEEQRQGEEEQRRLKEEQRQLEEKQKSQARGGAHQKIPNKSRKPAMFILCGIVICFFILYTIFMNASDLKYEIVDDHVVITKYKGDDAEVVIPSEIKGRSVTEIGSCAFWQCSSLVSITIPDGVTGIGSCAFSGCSSLVSISIPDGVTRIGYNAFLGCRSLASIMIPDGVTVIEARAFEDCRSLASITIPDSVTRIENYAFKDCTELTSIVIPEHTEVSDNAFEGCNASVIIALSAAPISDFEYVTSDYGVEIIKYKGDDMSVVIPSEINGSPVIKIGKEAFKSQKTLTEVVLPDSVTWIGESAFAGCIGLTDIKIPDSVTQIEDYAFENCTGLDFIVIPEHTKVSDEAFWGCNDPIIFPSELDQSISNDIKNSNVILY